MCMNVREGTCCMLASAIVLVLAAASTSHAGPNRDDNRFMRATYDDSPSATLALREMPSGIEVAELVRQRSRPEGRGRGGRDIHACMSMKNVAFKSNPDTTVTLIKVFRKGDTLALADTPTTPAPLVATSDVCLVKLIVGPGNPGPADAPSTSQGIGIEVWLPAPADWNGRIRVLGLGGWAGSPLITSTTDIFGDGPSTWATSDGYVGVVHDGGHVTVGGGSFAMNPDGTINTTLMRDLASRSSHETAVKTKILTEAFYREPHEYAYFEGCSSGGRQAYMEAQAHPDDFDGILASAPSINQTQFFPSLLYPQIVTLNDLGGVHLTEAQLGLASSAAVSACDDQLNGQHDGFISDAEACAYDVTTDPAVLCVADGGTNATDSCLTETQANAVNKMWYGPTFDGTAPPPSVDNGQAVFRSSSQRYWGVVRGEFRLAVSLAGPAVGSIWTDQVALNLQDVSYAGSNFVNASGEPMDRWRELDYAGFVNVLDQGLVLNDTHFGNIDTNDPDLRPFRDSGGKMLTFHGLADPLVAPSSTKNYYSRTSNLVGGHSQTQEFHRLYFVPGLGHCRGVGSADGIPGVSPPANPPLPATDQMFDALVDWVENGNAPTSITVTTTDGTISRPLCMYPAKQTYIGGDVNSAASYACQ